MPASDTDWGEGVPGRDDSVAACKQGEGCGDVQAVTRRLPSIACYFEDSQWPESPPRP